MILTTNEANLITLALSIPIGPSEATPPDSFEEYVEKMAADIFKTDDRGRSPKEILASTRKGMYGEMMLYSRFKSMNMNVEWNDPNKSGSYGWDLLVEGLKVEVKSQSRFMSKGYNDKAPKRKYFSFNDPKKIETAILLNKSIDLVIGWFPNGSGDHQEVHPWVLIDAKALGSDLGLFKTSKYPNRSGTFGLYLDMEKSLNENRMTYLCPI